jgi:hypothetical protein
MITYINIGLDPSRLQQGEPCFFVNWICDGKQNYKFFIQRFQAEAFKRRLEFGSK